MAKLVTKCKYLKAGSKKNIGGYAEYIATREGVDKIDDTIKHADATKKQQEFIEKITKDFPDTKAMLEYEDYKKKQTIGTATEFITRAIEEHLYEEMDLKTYADYIATRPRAERFGAHGLFTYDGEQVQLKQVSRELNLHQGNVWTFIISLRREDASRLGFDEGKRWRTMLQSNAQELADSLKIPLENLKWYAAFHNESHHPHVHMIAYSSDEQEGYLTKQGVKKLRSSLAKSIFAQDLFCIYEEQTRIRDELRRVGKEEVEGIVNAIRSGEYRNSQVEEMLLELAKRLKRTKGKKVYGYLKTDLKALVDGIVEILSKEENIQKLYALWYEQTEAIKGIYTSSMPERVPLSQNKEFKTIRNAVVYEAMRMIREEEETANETIQAARGVEGILYHMSKVLEDKIKTTEEGMRGGDRKLRLKEQEKKEAHGLKQ